MTSNGCPRAWIFFQKLVAIFDRIKAFSFTCINQLLSTVEQTFQIRIILFDTIFFSLFPLRISCTGYYVLANFFPSNAFLRRRRKKALLRVNDRGGGWKMCILALRRVCVSVRAHRHVCTLQLTHVAMAILRKRSQFMI